MSTEGFPLPPEHVGIPFRSSLRAIRLDGTKRGMELADGRGPRRRV